jgi:hypothetical protein
MFVRLDEKRKFFDKLQHNPNTLTELKEGHNPEDSISSEKYI